MSSATFSTKREVATRLRCSLGTIDKLMKLPDPIPHLKIGRKVLFPDAALLGWLNRRVGGTDGR